MSSLHCLADATVTGNTYYGSVHRVDVTAYAYKVGNFQVYATMTKDTCAPVQEVLYGSYSNQGVECKAGTSHIYRLSYFTRVSKYLCTNAKHE